jgi:hypothetical protein
MAKIMVCSNDGSLRIEMQDIGTEEPWWVGVCYLDDTELTDRGNFEDSVQAAVNHIERHHE